MMTENSMLPSNNTRYIGIGFFLLFLSLILLRCFSFRLVLNEIDVLPSIYQYVGTSWLPEDWYLNLNVGYRNLFNTLFGRSITLLGFENGAYVSRIILYLFVSFSYLALARALKLKLGYAALVLAVFLYDQSLVAGEWIVGGVETKTLSYAFVLLAVSLFIRGRINLGLICCGVAFSFHVLVGLYAAFCIGIALLFSPGWRHNVLSALKQSWLFLIFGFNGVLFCYEQFTELGDVGNIAAWQEYVVFRVPHHTLPNSWTGISHLVLTPLFVLFSVWLLVSSDNKNLRFLGWHSIACALLIAIGFLVFAYADVSTMRYYFFRYPDVMLPLFGMLSIALFWQDILSDKPSCKLFGTIIFPYKSSFRALTNVVVVAALFLVLGFYAYGFGHRIHVAQDIKASLSDRLEMGQWIQANTGRDELFLIDPTHGAFYVESSRPAFVTWKHVPQKSGDVSEWVSRMKMLNGGVLPSVGGYGAVAQLRESYATLGVLDIRKIQQKYGVAYFLAIDENQYPFAKLFTSGRYTLYKL